MYSNSDNRELTSYNGTNQVANEFFEPLLSRYQGNLETSMRGSDFIFDSVKLWYYKCHIINLGRGGSYIDSPD